MKLISIKSFLEEIPEMGTLELAEIESRVSNELDRRLHTRTIKIVRDNNGNAS